MRLALLALAAAAAVSSATATTVPSALEDPNEVMEGVWTDCVAALSFTCLQKRALLFMDRLGRAQDYPLIPGVVSLVRKDDSWQAEDSESLGRSLDSYNDPYTLGKLVDTSVDQFFESHTIRLHLPEWLSPAETPRSSSLDFALAEPSEQGRKGSTGGGGGGKKGMKKMMMMMMMMLAGKAMMMGPLLIGMIKLAAIKALIMGFVSLTISKILILKKLKMKGGDGGGWSSGGGGGHGGGHGGGGGGGWSSSGSGSSGWDRSLSSHDFAYSSYLPQ